jgi:hypothetical protein
LNNHIKHTIYIYIYKLKAQWSDPVSLTFHCVLRKLYTEPSICASYHISVHLTTRFQRRRFFLEINQSAIRITCCGLVWYLIQQYFSYIVAVSVIDGENHRHVATHLQTLSHNVVHLALIEIWTHNISGDRHWLHI